MSKSTNDTRDTTPSALSTVYHLPSTQQRWDERYADLAPRERLEPTSFVTACLPQLPRHGYALDIAAGAGRHSLALAQHGLRVDAVDISGQGLYLAQRRAEQAGLTTGGQIRFILADLERPWLPHRPYDVVLVSFFLYRPLFPLIKARLRPGGWLVYETLVRGPHHQPDRQKFLLQPQELKQIFADFETLFYAETDQDQRPTAQLLARKVGT